MSARARVAVDPGSLTTKIAVSGGAGAPDRELLLRVGQPSSPWDPGRGGDALAAALATVRESRAEPDIDTAMVVAVPDVWLSGSAEGALRQEAIRHQAEDQLGLTGVSWVGQLASVAALAARHTGSAASGCYLICDAGGGGVRVAACQVSGRSVRPLAVHDAPGGGWADFDAAIRATLRAESDPGLAKWYLSAAEQDRRAEMVLNRARARPAFRDAPVYTLSGSTDSYELTAGQVANAFPQRIASGLESRRSGRLPYPPSPF